MIANSAGAICVGVILWARGVLSRTRGSSNSRSHLGALALAVGSATIVVDIRNSFIESGERNSSSRLTPSGQRFRDHCRRGRQEVIDEQSLWLSPSYVIDRVMRGHLHVFDRFDPSADGVACDRHAEFLRRRGSRVGHWHYSQHQPARARSASARRFGGVCWHDSRRGWSIAGGRSITTISSPRRRAQTTATSFRQATRVTDSMRILEIQMVT